MASGKILGMGLGMFLVVVLFVLPLKFVRGVIGHLGKPGEIINKVLYALGFVGRFIPVGAVSDLYK